ncbi:MAG: site-specific integrase, partial [Microbacterium gubbeenense]
SIREPAGAPRLHPQLRRAANVKAVQRMLGHKSAAMTLDTYADLFDDDLDDVAKRLDERALKADVGKVWAEAVS